MKATTLYFFAFLWMYATARSVKDGSPAPQKILVTNLNVCGAASNITPSDLENTLFATSNMGSLVKMVRYCSHNKSTIQGTIIPIAIHVPCTKATDGSLCDFEAWGRYVDDVMAKSNYIHDKYDHRIYIVPGRLCAWCGIGYVNCSSNGQCRSWISSDCAGSISVYMHELGHNWGLQHASFSTNEYGDVSDAMGYCCTRRCYNPPHAEQLGWVKAIRSLSIDELVSSKGKVTRYKLPLASTHSVNFLKLKLPSKWFYLQYRRSSPMEHLPWDGLYVYSTLPMAPPDKFSMLETHVEYPLNPVDIIDRSTGVTVRVMLQSNIKLDSVDITLEVL